MKTIISPAKGFEETDIQPETLPALLEKVKKLNEILKNLNIEDIMAILKVKEDIAKTNAKRFNDVKFDKNGQAALFTYDGLQYKNMERDSFNQEDINYCRENIYIMSGYYGILNSLDSIYPHRLDYMAKFKTDEYKNLYDFWKGSVAKHLLEKTNDNEQIVNLSSNEFLKSIEKHIPKDKIINIIFKVEKNGKLTVHSTASKQARGKMVNYIVKNKIEKPEQLKNFDIDGYKYEVEMSDDNSYTFVKHN